ncbi:MAG TPA: NAD(P)H-binding protein [Verrucomicrobiae bacterium]|nr:NAD(P)H-binding protein [Verrucomicrobiae bacterium]
MSNTSPTSLRIAITGGTGFVGRTLARRLIRAGHEVVLIARGVDRRDPATRALPRSRFCPIGLDDPAALAQALAGCDAVAHCAGINREIGPQTYQRVHVEGTAHVVAAARQAGVKKIVLLSFLRARPNCGSGYHESKWQAEELVRRSGLDYTIFKPGVIYGRGDHMLDHLSHAFHTFPIFGLVGFRDQLMRPLAVDDMARLLQAALVEGRLSGQTVAVTGPEELTLRDAVRRVAAVTGRGPWMFPLPVWFHYGLAWCVERLMVIPLVSVAQVRILSEGLVVPCPPADLLPADLAPSTGFTKEQIRQGLPAARPFGVEDLRCCSARCS